MSLFKIIRILILLAVFVVVAFYAKNQKLKSRSWTEPLSVVIYRINGDNNSPVVNEYINELDAGVFEPVDRFMRQQSEKYKLITQQPTQIQMGPVLTVQPPEAPLPGSGYASIIWWGLKFRYWTYKNTPDSDSDMRRIRVFVLYHTAVEGRSLQHSLGLDKGLAAVIHAFASIDQDQQNNIVIAHELRTRSGQRTSTLPITAPCFQQAMPTRSSRPFIRKPRLKSWLAASPCRKPVCAWRPVWTNVLLANKPREKSIGCRKKNNQADTLSPTFLCRLNAILN